MTGYRGRTGIYELIEIGDAYERRFTMGRARDRCCVLPAKHSPGIDADGRRRIISGETSLEEVLRVTTVN